MTAKPTNAALAFNLLIMRKTSRKRWKSKKNRRTMLPSQQIYPVSPAVTVTLSCSFCCCSAFNHPLAPQVLPQSLVLLKLSAAFSQPITEGCLPNGLKMLGFELGARWNWVLPFDACPVSLTRLELPASYSKSLSHLPIDCVSVDKSLYPAVLIVEFKRPYCT